MATTTLLTWGGASLVLLLLAVIFFLLWRSERKDRKRTEDHNSMLVKLSARSEASRLNAEADRRKLREENARLLDLPGLVDKLNRLSASNRNRPSADPVSTD